MNDNERAYKTMNSTGIISVIIGITLIVISLAVGVLNVVNGARLIKDKKNIIF